MQISPLKKKINISLNTSRDARTSLQDVITNQTEQIVKSNQLEQELHRVNQQRKLLNMELDDLSNKYVEKSQALQECELENALLRRQIQAYRQQEDISKLHILLQQKNHIILEWTKKFEIMEKRLENESKLEQQVKQQQFQNDILKQQINELKQQQLISSKNYIELKEERNQYYRKSIDLFQAFQKLDNQYKQLEKDRNQIQSELIQFKQDCQIFKEQLNQVESILKKKNKWKLRYQDLIKESQQNQIENSSESMVEQLKAEVQIGYNEKELNLIENNNNEELNDMKDKLQQLEQENQYLREQNIELQNQFQSATDKLLKQQLQSSMIKEQSQTFSFVKYHHEYCDSLEEQQIQD
ncbi:unnamed protein product [Paramecium pentaurelia]|uniref:Uncharacterized protein n=1 Tax=Paramecium pentaurelia TaxID=43138 RepID=A0A8S1TUK8_9CILI|nr:unnamed protein product [Paramecium pentaurelia]